MRKLHACFIVLGFHAPWNEGNKVIAKSIIYSLSRSIEVSVVSPARQNLACNKDVKGRVNIKYVHILENIPAPDYLYEMQILRRLKEVNSRGANVYHIFDGINYSYAAVIARMFRKPVIVHSSFYEYYYRTKLKKIKEKFGPSFYSRYISLFLPTSPLVAKKLFQDGVGQSKVKILPPPIDVNVFKPLNRSVVRTILGIDQSAFLITYLGTLRPKKFPHKVILRSLSRLIRNGHKNMMLYIASPLAFYDNTGIENMRYTQQILSESNSLGINRNVTVKLVDLSEEEKVLLFNSSDVVLIPYIRPSAIDPPISLLEAMSCGAVVVASNIQSVPYIIKDKENGFLLNGVTIDGLYNVLNHIVKHRDELANQKQKARSEIVKHFGLGNVTSKLLSFYDLIDVT